MNYESLYSDTLNICKAITSNHELADDLTSEVMLIVLSLDNVEQLYKEEPKKCLNYVFGVAYKQWNWQGSPFNRANRGTYFDVSDRKWKRWNTTDVEEYRQVLNVNDEVELFELLKDLTEIESIWVCEYHKRNCSIKKLSEDSGIHRKSITKRLNEIFNKIRYDK